MQMKIQDNPFYVLNITSFPSLKTLFVLEIQKPAGLLKDHLSIGTYYKLHI